MKWLLILSIAFLPPIANALTLKEQTCLYNAVFYEANTEGKAGRRAIVDVVFNRSKKQGKNVCSIIKQRGQFSWLGKKSWKQLDKPYLDAVLSTNRQLDAYYTHFYLANMKHKPKWRKGLKCVKLNSHMFCKPKESK